MRQLLRAGAVLPSEEFKMKKSEILQNSVFKPVAQDPNPNKFGTFRDAFILGDKLNKMIEKGADSDQVVGLLHWNRYILNSKLLGSVMKKLYDSSQFDACLIVFEYVKSNWRIKETPAMYTLVLNSIAKKALSLKDRTEMLEMATEIWDGIETKTLIHMNSYLNVCVSCANEGGWEKAFWIYNHSVRHESLKQFDQQIPKADLVSFVKFFQILAKSRNESKIEAADDVFKSFKRLGLVADDVILGLYFSCCLADTQKCIHLIETQFKLSMDISDSNSINLDPKTLDILVKFATRISRTDLAEHWKKCSESV